MNWGPLPPPGSDFTYGWAPERVTAYRRAFQVAQLLGLQAWDLGASGPASTNRPTILLIGPIDDIVEWWKTVDGISRHFLVEHRESLDPAEEVLLRLGELGLSWARPSAQPQDLPGEREDQGQEGGPEHDPPDLGQLRVRGQGVGEDADDGQDQGDDSDQHAPEGAARPARPQGGGRW